MRKSGKTFRATCQTLLHLSEGHDVRVVCECPNHFLANMRRAADSLGGSVTLLPTKCGGIFVETGAQFRAVREGVYAEGLRKGVLTVSEF